MTKEYTPSEHQLNDVEQNRHLYIGGSDLPMILMSKKNFGKSVIQFAKEKLKIVPSTFSGNEYTRYGQYMEPLIRNYMCDVFGYKFVEDSIIDSKRMYRGNCDGIDKKQKMLLEVKTFSKSLDVAYYTPQCQFYMELFDIEECLLVGYNRPDDFYTGIDFTIESDVSYFNLDFDESRIVVYKLHRDRDMFKNIEIQIEHFKYLCKCLQEDAILNNSNIVKGGNDNGKGLSESKQRNCWVGI